MRYKFEFEADDDFSPGDCYKCPFSYEEDSYVEDDDYDDYDYWTCCAIRGRSVPSITYGDNSSEIGGCPLEEVK